MNDGKSDLMHHPSLSRRIFPSSLIIWPQLERGARARLNDTKNTLCTLAGARFGSCASAQKAHPALRHLIIAPEAGNETKSASVRIKMKMRLCELCVVCQFTKSHWTIEFCEKKFREVPEKQHNQTASRPQAREVHSCCSEETVLKVLKSWPGPGAPSSSQMRLLPEAPGLMCSQFSRRNQNSAFSRA